MIVVVFEIDIGPERDAFAYREGERILRMKSAQMAYGEYAWCLLKSDIDQWELPHQNDRVDSNERERIVRNIEGEVWRLLHGKVEWIKEQ